MNRAGPHTGLAEPAEPAWEVARLFPAQGMWSEQEYLDLKGNRLVEFTQGFIEVLPMPTTAHQLIVELLHRVLAEFVRARGLGTALFAPLRARLWPGKFREPDVLFMLTAHAARMGDDFWDGADLVMEVVSSDDRRRDLETKRLEYARAGIPEYWIVDPQEKAVIVLKLESGRYAVHGRFEQGARAVSALLEGFSIGVADVFAAAGGRKI